MERFNQMLMNKIAKMFNECDNNRYNNDIQDIVNEYNNTYHSSIKMAPVEASKQENEGIVYYNLYNKRRREMLKQNNKPRYRKGDIVKISRYQRTFQKGYDKQWTNDKYFIYKYNNMIPPTYKIKQLKKSMVTMNT